MELYTIFEAKHLREIVQNYLGSNDIEFINYKITPQYDKMLGFLGDYSKLSIEVKKANTVTVHNFFVKSIARSNPNKAKMINELGIIAKETVFYRDIKELIYEKDSKPWCAKLALATATDLVFEDLTSLGYLTRNKFLRFDLAHCKQALETIARFHSASIIHEERKSLLLGRRYSLQEDNEEFINNSSLKPTNTWFLQCMEGALEAMQAFSKYGRNGMLNETNKDKWRQIWTESLTLSGYTKCRKVICHQDLWNNNILFHYDSDTMEPDGCMLVDFQAVQYNPLTCDVMMLLYCNLEDSVRKKHTSDLLTFYYDSLTQELKTQGIIIEEVLQKDDFLESAEANRKWGLVITACLLPQFWIDDDLTTKIFTNSDNFEKHLVLNKGDFIKDLMRKDADYKVRVLEIFETIFEQYVL